MVEVIITDWIEHYYYGGGQPLIHIHTIERHVFGNSVCIHVYGEMKIAAKEVVFARDLKLNTIQVLLLTPEAANHTPYIVEKWIYHKGEYGNYASIDIFGVQGYELRAGADRTQLQTPVIDANSDLPYDGSLWLNFEAIGE
jgi:hypothetical protein